MAALNERSFVILHRLSKCEPHKGLVLTQSEVRYAGMLTRLGFAEWMGFYRIKVYLITDAGRKYLKGKIASERVKELEKKDFIQPAKATP
jgi:hypothetical protein